MEKIVLIDGHSILNRAFYGVPDLTNSEGLHTNAVYGFLNIMLKILDEEQPQYLAVAFDVHHPTFRHELYGEYKGTRKAMPEELREQVPVIKEVLCAMGVCILELPGYEADDILGTVAKRAEKDGLAVRLVSGDRDMLQLASDHICIRIPKTKKGVTTIENYFAADFTEQTGVTPTEFIDVKALMGDTSDNIPGVSGIGEKTAYALIGQYHSIDQVFSHLGEIKPNRAKNALEGQEEIARLSRTLAEINTDSPVEFALKDGRLGALFTPAAYPILKRLELKSLIKKFDEDSLDNQDFKEKIVSVTDWFLAENVFEQAKTAEQLGLQLITEGECVVALSLCMDKEKVYVILPEGFITENYLAGQAQDLLNGKNKVAVLNLKGMLPFVDAQEDPGQLDLGVGAYLLNPLKNSYDCDDIARDYLGMTIPSRADSLGKATLLASASEQPEKFLVYAGYLSYVAFMAAKKMETLLRENQAWELYQEIELPLIYSLYGMEKAGIRVRREELEDYGKRLKVRIDEVEQSIYDQVGEPFNINSPKQLGTILFDKLQMPHAKKTKTGYSTSADILEKLAVDYPVVNDILEYRQLTKLNSTYAEGLAGYIREDGRIHGTFNQTITATGRISSTEPNLQNIPVRMELGREIRKVFVPKEGCLFVDADYSQIELRILAHMSGDQQLIEAYNSGQDIHRITASQVFHIPFDQVTPEMRRNAKAVNFGIIYGISAFGLSEDLSISRQEALDYINRYFETYPQIKVFLDRLVSEGKENGYVSTVFGRRRPVPELSSSNFMQRQFGERIAMNAPIQGTAADVMKIAMVRVDRELKRQGLASRIVLQVHDELLLEVPFAEEEQVKALVREAMMGAARMAVPLEIEIQAGKSWYETK
ncbi:MAG: DNA polymerase I [Lachnospiraceae bacterium]|nr:DNA polymerase I [Lachnospiraceae bacterium]